MRSRCLRVVAAMGAVACLLSGCASKPDESPGASRATVTTAPATTPTTGVTSTSLTQATPSTTMARVSLPPAATAHTEDGAQAFATYYTLQMDEALHHADSRILRALSAGSCTGCEVGIKLADQLKAKGQHNATTTFSIAGTRLSELTTANQLVVDVWVDDKGGVTIDQAGAQVRQSAPAKFTLRQSLRWQGAGWLVVESVLL